MPRTEGAPLSPSDVAVRIHAQALAVWVVGTESKNAVAESKNLDPTHDGGKGQGQEGEGEGEGEGRARARACACVYILNVPRLYKPVLVDRCEWRVVKGKAKVIVSLHKYDNHPWRFLKG